MTEIVRVAVVLKPTKGEPLAYVAESSDGSRRRYAVELPAEPHAPGWLPAGTYGVQVLGVGRRGAGAAQVGSGSSTIARRWQREMAVEIAEEPRRPLVSGQEAA